MTYLDRSGLQVDQVLVDFIERDIEIIERADDGNRAKRFLAGDVAGVRHVLQQGRFEHGALPFAAAEQRRAIGNCFVDPAFEALGFLA